MLLSYGKFDGAELIAGAKAMANGKHAPVGVRVREHPHGWGLIHRPLGEQVTHVLKREGPLGTATYDRFPQIEAGLTIIHARHATLPTTIGAEFTHPLERDGMFFFHNGYTPNAIRGLRWKEDSFDTLALFNWISPPGTLIPSPSEVRARLDELGPGCTSANSFLVAADSFLVVNWFEIDPGFYTLWRLDDERGFVCASEPIPEIAERKQWRPMGHGEIILLRPEGGSDA